MGPGPQTSAPVASANFMVVPIGPEPQRRGTEPGNSGLPGEALDLAGVLEGGCQRLVDEERLMRDDDGLGLRQMNAAIAAFEQDRVHLGAQRRHVRCHLHAVPLLQLIGVAVPACAPGGELRAYAATTR